MARDLNVEDMIEAELRRDSRAKAEDLHFLAGRIDPALQDISLSEFKARFLSGGAADGAADSPSQPTRRRKATRAKKPRRPGTRTKRSKPAAKRARRSRAAPAAPSADASMATAPPANGLEAERVRAVLNRFARDLSAAEKPGQVIKVMAGLERYVKEIVGG